MLDKRQAYCGIGVIPITAGPCRLPMPIASINPSTGELLKSYASLTPAEVTAKIQLAANTFLHYRSTSFAERARCMMKAAQILEEQKDALARVMTLEMGKPIRAAVDEVV